MKLAIAGNIKQGACGIVLTKIIEAPKAHSHKHRLTVFCHAFISAVYCYRNINSQRLVENDTLIPHVFGKGYGVISAAALLAVFVCLSQ